MPANKERNPHGNRSHAVRGQRHEAVDSLDLFCTPPWATRAFVEECLMKQMRVSLDETVWEPASGLGHMADPLKEYFDEVWSTDIFDYGYQDDEAKPFVSEDDTSGQLFALSSFRAEGGTPHWIITNPPFNDAEKFVHRALTLAKSGVAVLVRPTFAETLGRYNRLYAVHKPSIIYQYSERVPMVKGRWQPDASSATAYQWFVWRLNGPGKVHRHRHGHSEFDWIPPGQCERHTKSNDAERFADRRA